MCSYSEKQVVRLSYSGGDSRRRGTCRLWNRCSKKMSKELTDIYGKGFTKTNLYSFYSFYKCFPQILHSMSGKSNLLSWTHYRTLLQVEDSAAREWYAREASEQAWSVRTLQRNISSQYYYRLLKSQQKESMEQEMKQLTDGMNDKLEFIKKSCYCRIPWIQRG